MYEGDEEMTPRADGRFRKGQSGNPKGRPRRTPDGTPASAFDVIVDRTLTVTQNGVPQEVTVEEALQHKTYQAAISGSRLAGREVLKMILRREAALAKANPTSAPGCEIRPKPPAKGVDPALLLLGIACQDPRDYGSNDKYQRLLLEPWAVEAALARRRGGTRLTQQDMDDIRRRMHRSCALDRPPRRQRLSRPSCARSKSRPSSCLTGLWMLRLRRSSRPMRSGWRSWSVKKLWRRKRWHRRANPATPWRSRSNLPWAS